MLKLNLRTLFCKSIIMSHASNTPLPYDQRERCTLTQHVIFIIHDIKCDIQYFATMRVRSFLLTWEIGVDELSNP